MVSFGQILSNNLCCVNVLVTHTSIGIKAVRYATNSISPCMFIIMFIVIEITGETRKTSGQSHWISFRNLLAVLNVQDGSHVTPFPRSISLKTVYGLYLCHWESGNYIDDHFKTITLITIVDIQLVQCAIIVISVRFRHHEQDINYSTCFGAFQSN